MVAFVNPAPENMYPPADNGASGYGLVRFNKKTRDITIECWSRGINVTQINAKQYPGFPVTIKQEDNYGKNAVAFLPTIEVKNEINPRIQIIDEHVGEIVYTLRMNGRKFRPKVFKKGKYTVYVGEGKRQQVIKNISSLKPGESQILELEL